MKLLDKNRILYDLELGSIFIDKTQKRKGRLINLISKFKIYMTEIKLKFCQAKKRNLCHV